MIAAIGFFQLVQSVVGTMPDIPARDKPHVIALVCAIGTVESGGRDLKPYHDVNGAAWGYFGMHKARWGELVKAEVRRRKAEDGISDTRKVSRPGGPPAAGDNLPPSSFLLPPFPRWNAATPKQQIEVFARAVFLQMKEARQAGEDSVRWVAAWHNGRGPMRLRTSYLKKVHAALEQIER